MSRKKPRTSPRGNTGITTKPAAVTAALEPRALAPQPAGEPAFFETPLGRIVHRLLHIFGSLQLAIVLMVLFTAALMRATWLEQGYKAAVAQALIYRAWWFALLLVLLGVCVVCAALKKYPWKRQQTGFLITHTGLITLVFGSLLTALFGVEGQMQMIDTPDRELQAMFGVGNSSRTIHLADQQALDVARIPNFAAHGGHGGHGDRVLQATSEFKRGELSQASRDFLAGKMWALSLSPGPLTWYDDDRITVKTLPANVRMLRYLAYPFPGASLALDGAHLQVVNFYPNTELWDYGPATDKDRASFPALKLRIKPPFGRPVEEWAVPLPGANRGGMPLAVEMLVLKDAALLQEFLKPPAPAEMGKHGQLVVAAGPQKSIHRFNLDAALEGKAQDLPGTGLKLTVGKVADLGDFIEDKALVRMLRGQKCPAVAFEVSGPAGKAEYLVCENFPHFSGLKKGDEPAPLAFWYHYPDFRRGDEHLKGSLQFLQAPDGKVYYRAFGSEGVKPGGEIDVRAESPEEYELPLAMKLRFQVAGYLEKATVAHEGYVVPRDIPPGAEPSVTYHPAVRCTLNADGKAHEFFLRLYGDVANVMVGKDLYLVRYRPETRDVGVELTLKRAQEEKDPGTNRSASFKSDVVVKPLDRKGEPYDFPIYMNHTLDYGPFTFYQANYQRLTDPRTLGPLVDPQLDRVVSLTGLTVAHDPGLLIKYTGVIVVVLGILTMFYMKAYFFKPRGRKAAEAAA